MSVAPQAKPERFAMVPIRITKEHKLQACTWCVFIVLLGYANKSGRVWVSLETISREAGIARRNVSRHINALIAAGYLERTDEWYRHSKGRKRVYEITGARVGARMTPTPVGASGDVNHPTDYADGLAPEMMSTDAKTPPEMMSTGAPVDASGDAQSNQQKESDQKESDQKEVARASDALPDRGDEHTPNVDLNTSQDGSLFPELEIQPTTASKKAAREGVSPLKQRGNAPKPRKAGRPRKPPATDLPPNWEPSVDGIAYAISTGMTDIARETAKFRTYYQGEQRKRWPSCWNNWCDIAAKIRAEQAERTTNRRFPTSPARVDRNAAQAALLRGTRFEHQQPHVGTTIEVTLS